MTPRDLLDIAELEAFDGQYAADVRTVAETGAIRLAAGASLEAVARDMARALFVVLRIDQLTSGQVEAFAAELDAWNESADGPDGEVAA